MIRSHIWIIIMVQMIATCRGEIISNDEPLGRNYRKNYNNNYSINSNLNNGKIISTSETKISSVSYKPNESNEKNFDSLSNTLKTAASEEEKFSIGLGVLSPSYSQKFGDDGKTKLDFNSDKSGFSYSLTNVVHPQQPGASSSASLSQGTSTLPTSSSPSSATIATNTLNKVQSAGFIPSAYYNQPPAQPNPHVNIYHKQSADPNQAIYNRLSNNNYAISSNPTSSSPYSTNENPFGLLDPSSISSAPQYNPSSISSHNNLNSNYPNSPSLFNPYNPYNSALVSQQSYNPTLNNPQKPFLPTVANNLHSQNHQLVAHHQHSLPQSLPSSQQSSAQPIIQPKLVAQQQLTANVNPMNIVHNDQYAAYNNPYTPPANQQQPFNPNLLQGAYAGLLNMAASQQYPIAETNGMGDINYDYLNEPFLY